MTQSLRSHLGAGALVLALAAGCHTPLIHTQAGSFESDDVPRVVSERPGVVRQVLLYVPNRIVDLLDVVHAGIGLGLGIGPDVRVTSYGQLALQAGVGVGLQWDDRAHSPGIANASATAALGPFRTGAGAGSAASIGQWEVGASAAGLKFAVDLEEVVDFVLGWFFVDFRRDDYGWE